VTEQAKPGKWVKGMPSPNALGRGATVAKAKRAAGSDAVVVYAGYVQETGEGSSKLTGREKWVTYANAFTHPAVAISLLLRSALLSGTKWSLTENAAGGKDAARGVEIIEQGLLKARLPKPWSKVASKAALHYYNGFSLHAASIGRRPDGMVVFTDIAHRPPHTIEKWFRADPQSPWSDVQQRIDDGNTYPIALDQCLYLVNDQVSDSPTGTGVLRFVVERLRRIGHYEALEGSEMFGSMGGTPVYRAPFEALYDGAEGTPEEKQAVVTAKTQVIRDAVKNRIKTPEKQQYLGLSSRTYQGSDPNSISTVKEWDIEILKGELQGLAEIRKVITDSDLHVARILGVEFVFVGGGDTAGTYGMHESKVELFASTLQSDLDALATAADQQLVRRLIAANGLDPDTAAPTLVPSPIVAADVEKQARVLGLINLAGLPPNHPAKIAMFERLKLPWADEDESDLMAPRRPMPTDPNPEDAPPIEDPDQEPAQ